MDIDNNDKNESSFIIQGSRQFIVRLADNSKKETEDDERSSNKSRIHFNIPNKIICHRTRGFFHYTWRRNYYYNYNNIKRQRHFWFGKGRNIIIVRNLAEEITNSDIKSIFEKIGPIRRCGIIWNRQRGIRDIAEVEYVYCSDAYKAYRILDYKSIKGLPIRIQIKGMPKKMLLGSREYLRKSSHYMDYRNFRFRNYYNRMEKIMARNRHFHHHKKNSKNAMRFWREKNMYRRARYIN